MGYFVIGIVIGIVIAICGFFLHFYSKKELGKKFFEDSEKPFKKKAPETALELAMGFRNTIAKLEFMPKQHELDEDEELAARQIRKCYYKNYKIYFFIDDRACTVYVLRVLHMLVNAKPLLLNMRF